MSDKEVIERLDRIAIATEKAAARLWWIAMPIYLSVAVLLIWIIVAVLVLVARQ